MASSPELVNYIVDQLAALPDVRSRKMFGDYGLYACGKFCGVICDDQLFLKPTEAGQALVPDAVLAEPYPGGSPMLRVDDVDDRARLCALVRVTCEALPAPKPKPPRKKPPRQAGGI